MATIDQYKIVVDVQGEQAVNRLRDSIGGLGTVIAGIGFGAFVAGAFKMADAMNDIAASSGLAVGEVAALAEALKEAGGEYDDVGKIVARFYNTLEQAAGDSSSKAAEALQKVGITLKELRTLSEGELLSKAIGELARMEAGAQRTALGMEIFGKSFAKIDPATLQKILETKDVEKLQQEMLKAAEVVGNLEASFFELQKAALSVLAPLIGETDNFRISAEQAEKIVKILGITMGIAFGAAVVRNIITIVGALGTLIKTLRATAIAQAAVAALAGPAGWAALAGAAAAATAAVYGLDKLLEQANKETVALGNNAERTGAKFGQMGAGRGGAFPGATGITKQQEEARKKEALAAQQVTEQMIRQNQEANKLRQLTIDTIGMESTRANLIKANAQAESDSRRQIADLDAKIAAERAKGKDANQAVIVELEKQKVIVQGQVQEVIRLNELEAKRTLELQKQRDIMSASNELINLAAQRNINAEKAINQQKVIQGQLTQDQANYLNQHFTLQEEHLAKLAELNMALGKAEEDKDEAAISRLKVAIGIEKTRFIDASKNLQSLREQQESLNQSIIAGSVAAMNNIAKQFEPYKMAQDAIMQGWNRIGSAVDEFVETGKFKFKDFARSVIQDLLKMIIKAQLFKAIQSSLGFFGLKIPGLASGGPAKAGQPYIVGEKGPELFVPKNPGTVIPNNKLPSATQATGSGMVTAPITNNYITNNISAIDSKSVAQLFAENRKTLLGTVQMAQKEMPYQTR